MSAVYDPNKPIVSSPWTPWAQPMYRRSEYSRAAFMTLYGLPAPPIGGAPWSPEQELLVEERRVILPHEFRSAPELITVDPQVMRILDESAERLLSLSPRQFEEFVAGVLERLGYRATVSPVGRDGGIDIIADRDTAIGAELVIVQCKRYAPDKKVGVPTVKQLCAVVDDQKATRGLVVTTSTFTSVALKYIDWKKHKVSGADHAKLQEWMRIVRGAAPA